MNESYTPIGEMGNEDILSAEVERTLGKNITDTRI